MSESGSSFKLIIEDDEGRRSIVPIELGEVSVGRADGNTIRLNERNISRRHARLLRENGHVLAEDLDSYNGVWINGDRVKGRQQIHDGDMIRVGDFQLELRGEGLARRTEDTTQRTLVAESGSEVTRPDIRLQGEGEAQARGAASGSDGESPHEPTAVIRLDQVAEGGQTQKREAAAIAGAKAKLVCVSTQFAGAEFEIDKTEMVIGRTDDNDIAIDHRSVSRNHAKVVVSGKSYRIMDMKSANGTLVNGEEYAQIELKKGDLVELGHVKFRFVPPGESYDFTADELAALKSSGTATGKTGLPRSKAGAAKAVSSPRPLVAGGLSVIGVLVLGLVVFMTARNGTEAPQEPASDGQQEHTLADPAPSVAPAPAAAAAPSVAPAATASSADMLSRAKAALAQQQWPEALKLADAIIVLEPSNAEAVEIAGTAKAEIAAQASLDKAMGAAERQAWAEAWELLQEIPKDSAARARAQGLIGKVQPARVQELVEAANAALRDQDFDEARQLASELGEVDPANPEAERIASAADAASRGDRTVAGGRQPPRDRTGRGSSANRGKGTGGGSAALTAGGTQQQQQQGQQQQRGSSTTATAENGAAPPVDAKTYYQQGIQALQAQQNDKAIELLDKCVKADSKFGLCYRALGITYARLKNGPKAARFYRLYIQVMPNAQDRPQVEQLLKQYDQTAQ